AALGGLERRCRQERAREGARRREGDRREGSRGEGEDGRRGAVEVSRRGGAARAAREHPSSPKPVPGVGGRDGMRRRLGAALGCAAALSACRSASEGLPAGDAAAASADVARRTGTASVAPYRDADAPAATRALLSKPLTDADAVKVALLEN